MNCVVGKIIIDADACPKSVLEICQKISEIYKVRLITVASFNHQIKNSEHIVVGNASQEADLKIMNIAQENDIVVTQDWGLAAMLLAKKVQCLTASGRVFSELQIDFLLEEREIKAKQRRAGGKTKGPKKRKAEDDSAFEQRVLEMLKGPLNQV